jgi:hypothetical protein
MAKPGDSDTELEHYRAMTRWQELSWQTRNQKVLHSDRAAVDLGLTTLQTAILINGGAVLAILAFVGQLWGKESEILTVVLHDAAWFMYGVLSAGAAAFVAYFYQSFLTAEHQYWLYKSGDDDISRPVWFLLRIIAAVIMIGLVLVSYAFFALGAFKVMATMAH